METQIDDDFALNFIIRGKFFILPASVTYHAMKYITLLTDNGGQNMESGALNFATKSATRPERGRRPLNRRPISHSHRRPLRVPSIQNPCICQEDALLRNSTLKSTYGM